MAEMKALSILPLLIVSIGVQADDLKITIDASLPGLRVFRVQDALLSQSFDSHPSHDLPRFSMLGPRYPVHTVTSTVFSVGENAVEGGGIDNYRSAWDSRWLEHFGSGLGQNPFYVALPVNDVTSDHST